MSNLLDDGMNMLATIMASSMSETVTYHRGGESVSLAATVGATAVNIADENGASVRTTEVDFIVAASSLIIDGWAVDPRAGDRIRRAADATNRVALYEVVDTPIGAFKRTGPLLRIHVQAIDEEAGSV